MWAMRYLLKLRFPSGPSAVRGIVAEKAVHLSLTKSEYDLEQLIAEEKEKQGVAAEVNGVAAYVTTALSVLEPLGAPSRYQERIDVTMNRESVLGYADFIWEEPKCLIDLKTRERLPSKFSFAELLQVAIYKKAFPEYTVQLCYATPKKCELRTPTGKEIGDAYSSGLKIVRIIHNFLALSDDAHALVKSLAPDPDHMYLWSEPESVALRQKVYGY